MNPDEELAIRNLQAKLSQSESNNAKLSQAVTLFQGDENDNLVKWQLDVEGELVRIERLLRKQIPKRDGKGNVYYVDCVDNQLFNEKGINETMNLLSWYLNKNIILSCYNDKQIDQIMFQFNEEIIDFFYTSMENFGMDTEDKKKHYPVIVMNIINIVDATYRRALDGRELDSLKTARIVSQNEPLGKNLMYPQVNSMSFNPLRPSTWKA